MLVPIIVLFQNCSSPEEEAAATDGQTNSSSVIFDENNPFPFKVSANYVSYMSCTNMATDFHPEAYHSFKIGAYRTNNNETHGLGLTDAFKDKNQSAEGDQLITAITNALPLSSLVVQANISRQGDFVPSADKLYNNTFLPALDSPYVLRKLASQKDNSVFYFNNVKGLQKRKFEASIYANSTNESDHKKLRMQLSGIGEPAVLSLGFSSETGKGYLLGPEGLISANSKTKAPYGSGLKMQFSTGSTLGKNDNYNIVINGIPSNRVISSVSEVNLSDFSTSSSNWSCPQSLKFMIVRPGDAATAGCQKRIYNPSNLNEHQKAVYNILKPEHWYVDFARRCIMPRKPMASCYGRAGQSHLDSYVNYHGIINGVAKCGGSANSQNKPVFCPHYATICYKN